MSPLKHRSPSGMPRWRSARALAFRRTHAPMFRSDHLLALNLLEVLSGGSWRSRQFGQRPRASGALPGGLSRAMVEAWIRRAGRTQVSRAVHANSPRIHDGQIGAAALASVCGLCGMNRTFCCGIDGWRGSTHRLGTAQPGRTVRRECRPEGFSELSSSAVRSTRSTEEVLIK